MLYIATAFTERLKNNDCTPALFGFGWSLSPRNASNFSVLLEATLVFRRLYRTITNVLFCIFPLPRSVGSVSHSQFQTQTANNCSLTFLVVGHK
jgi:hypothetical protein